MADKSQKQKKTVKIMALNNTSPSKHDSQFNGHSHNFVGKIPEELVCKLCSKVLKEPRQVVCCGGHYCHDCIKQRIATNYSCPNCRTANFNHFRDTHFEQRVNMLKIHCPHYKKGCRWTGEISALVSHLKSPQGCVYEATPCPNKCGQALQRKDLKDHLAKQCNLRRVKCQFCNHENTYQVVTGTHFTVCPNYPVKCPYNCGQRGIKRSELNKHETQCPNKPTVCPFQSAGCKVQLVQKDFNEHMASYTQHHLDLVTKSFDTLKARAENAERELRTAKAEVEDLQKKEEYGRQFTERKLKAIAFNADELVKSCSESQKVGIQSIRSLTDESFHIREIGQPIIFQLINYSEYKRSNKVWYSAPFYVANGYKMCLAVYANGTGIGKGSCVSIALCLMKGEFDAQVAWPVELPFHLIVEIMKQHEEYEGSSGANAPQNPRTYMYFHSDKPQDKVEDGTLLEARKCENFARHDLVEDWMLFYDAVTFQVSAESEFL